MTQATDLDTFTGMMQWLRSHGKNQMALPLRRANLGTLRELYAASEGALRDAGCSDDLIALILKRPASNAAPAEASQAAAGPAAAAATLPRAASRPGAGDLSGTGHPKAAGPRPGDPAANVNVNVNVSRRTPTAAAAGASPSDSAAAQLPAASAVPPPQAADTDEVLEAPPISYQPGDAVEIIALRANSALNGCCGVVEGFDDEKDRYIVDLGPAHGRKLFRGFNLIPSQTSRADPTTATQGEGGLASQDDDLDRGLREDSASPERPSPPPGPKIMVNRPLRPGAQVVVDHPECERHGQVGVCESFDFSTGLWLLRFERGEVLRLPMVVLEEHEPVLRPGAEARLENLTGPLSELNGSYAICDSYSAKTLCWRVQLESGEWRAVKETNLKPEDGSSRRDRDMKLALKENAHTSVFVGALEEALASGDVNWLDY